ncbi:unnamed protein product [Acanthoscelides obtectus]|uniref:GST N-terminal domain-containing protein n=3 Tax=Acanthoscelides obtectus TaxID=200917 RepID=A0A9P0JHB9_ACAOB|nr:unnamed protein product [Acanthoscelides obtectus]CAK1661300.1 Pyrimidodiazepine synthase [Acanthoscelides obtectus]
MSDKHLASGSVEPPREPGLLRLYSMKYCPFAQRPRLVLKAKGIPHDIVNINLTRKPEWYLKIHPKGFVPALLDGSDIILESIDICDYLEEKFPENSLYPSDPEIKKRDKELIQKLGPVTSTFYKCCLNMEEKTLEQWARVFVEMLQEFENELAERKTAYFDGDKPGMLDYLIWPWAERAGLITLMKGKLPLKDTDIPLLRKWRKVMQGYPICAELISPIETHLKMYQAKMNNVEPNYDE